MSKDSVIRSMSEKGFTYLGYFGGKELFCNLENKESIKKCLEYLESVTGEEWSAFQEVYGDCNIVLYKTRSFEQKNGYLRCKAGCVELPLNCSSCYRMFSWCKLEESLSLDTSKVKCMNKMFLNCGFSEDFLLDLDTSCVVNAEGMFTGCCINKGFKFGDRFDLSRVSLVHGLFAYCNFANDFVMQENFKLPEFSSGVFINAKLPERIGWIFWDDTNKVLEKLKGRGK